MIPNKEIRDAFESKNLVSSFDDFLEGVRFASNWIRRNYTIIKVEHGQDNR